MDSPLRTLLPDTDPQVFLDKFLSRSPRHARAPAERYASLLPSRLPDSSGQHLDLSSADGTREFLVALQRQLSLPFGPAHASVVDAGAGATTAFRFESDHVFLCQLQGAEHVRFGDRPALPAALRDGILDGLGRPVGAPPHEHEPLLADDGSPVLPPGKQRLLEVDLEPGDCLYLPPGTWYERAAKTDSKTLEIRPPRGSAAQAIAATLAAHLERDVRWRRDLRHADAIDRHAVEELVRSCERLDPRSFRRAFAQAMGHLEPTLTPCAAPPAQLQRDSILQLAGTGPLHYAAAHSPEGHETLYLYRGQHEFALPPSAAPFVEGLAANHSFRADAVLQWDRALPWESARELLTELVRVGLLLTPAP